MQTERQPRVSQPGESMYSRPAVETPPMDERHRRQTATEAVRKALQVEITGARDDVAQLRQESTPKKRVVADKHGNLTF